MRYDGYYAPQTLLMHENVHIEWDNPEMQKAKGIILSDLSEAEKKKLLSSGRYKDYLTLYKGDFDSVWEEFIADVFAGINDYTSDYIDTVVDYWYDVKVVDNYSPAEYTESIDTGGNADVLDAHLDNIPHDEYKQLQAYIMSVNNNGKRLKNISCKEIGNNFYVWKNISKTEYEIVDSIPIVGNEEFIDYYRGELNANDGKTQGIRKMYNSFYEGQRDGIGSRSDVTNRRGNVSDDRLSASESSGRKFGSDRRGYTGESGRDTSAGKIKYALSTYEGISLILYQTPK